MSKITLIIVGILLVIMGLSGIWSWFGLGVEPMWHAILKIAIGIIAVLIGAMDKQLDLTKNLFLILKPLVFPGLLFMRFIK